MVISLFFLLVGCANKDDTPKAYVPSKLASKWISTCEQDYLSSECTEMIIKMDARWSNDSNPLFTWIPPFDDPKDSEACSKDKESSECSAEYLISNSSIDDLTCISSESDEFGLGYFCYMSVLVRNTSNAPFDSYLKFTLWDKKGNSYASDVDGNFNMGLMPIEFESEPRIELNPGRGAIKYVGFSVANLDSPFDFIFIESWDNSLYSRIPLCPTKNDRFLGEDAEGTVIYEDARRLHSCKFVKPVEFEVRSASSN